MSDTIPYGLRYVPDLGLKMNDLQRPDNFDKMRSVKREFSDRDHFLLRDELLSIQDKCKMILEIGVCRCGEMSSTHALINNKNPETIYLGVDLRTIGPIVSGDNVHLLKTDSSNYEYIMETIRSLSGGQEIDFIHIDGFHSINQILKDWRFVRHLSRHGIVAVHDTSVHYGPSELFKAIDPEVFTAKKHFEDLKDDWGIGIIKRKK